MIAEKAEVVESSISPQSVLGDPVDLGYTIGAVTDRSISWTLDGVDYTIASQDLTKEEMTEIARSVQVEPIK